MELDSRKRWLALYILCLGDVMIVLDSTIVNVALPSIRSDLHFTQTSLTWVITAYLLTFGGFLLLGGRLGDLYGHSKLFLLGVAFFTLASLGCGLAGSKELLVIGRAVQGFGGAVVSAVALSLVMILFVTPADRAKAMGIFGFVLSGGGSAGVLLGGVITQIASWHWIFLVNVPIGIAVILLGRKLLPSEHIEPEDKRLDAAGAITVTAALMLAVYGISNANTAGWLSTQTLALIGAAIVLLVIFIMIEMRARSPLMPLDLFRHRNISTANVVGAMMAAGLFTFFVFGAFYLRMILHYNPLKVGLAYLPSTVVWGLVSFKFSDKAVLRFGIKPPIIFGLTLFSLGILYLVLAPVHANFWVHILPGMLIQGFGAGIAFNPLLLAAMGDVEPRKSGLASGVVNTALMMGGALGLAALSSVAASHTSHLLAGGKSQISALLAGYHLAFLIAGILVLAAAIVAALLFRPGKLPDHAVVPAGDPAAAAAIE